MVIGNGDIAKTLIEAIENGTLTDDRLFFASGVSNPNEVLESNFSREKELLIKQDKDLQIVYFSSQSVLNPQKKYAFHKLEMEKLIQVHFPKYAIARLGIITWGTNPVTTINFLKGKVARNEPFSIREVTRNVVEKADFIKQVEALPRNNNITLIDGKMMTEAEIFKKFVSRHAKNQ